MNKFMRIIIWFDLPVKKATERRDATKFRKFLLKDGYTMMQWSVYTRVCNGMDSVQTHKNRLKNNLPAKGSIRMLTLTEKQYDSIEILLGERLYFDKKDNLELTSIF